MLKKHAQFFKSLFIMSDLLILSLAWIFSYILRFYTTLIRPPILGTPSFLIYIQFLFPLLIIWSLFSEKVQLYRPRRIDNFLKELFDVVKCLTLTLIILIAVIYLFKRFEFSRLAFFYFCVMSIFGLISVRFFARKTLRMLRKRGYNQRFALIAGSGELGQKVLEKIELFPELGIQVIGFLTQKGEEIGKKICGILGLDPDTVVSTLEEPQKEKPC